MNDSYIVIDIVKMLLKPIDIEIFRALYVKAPKKRISSVPQKIPTYLKDKLTDDLVDEKNISYTLVQIKKGRLNKFYKFENHSTSNYNLQMLEELIKNHDPASSEILLWLLQFNNEKNIESFFKNNITVLKDLEIDWNEINWNDEKEKDKFKNKIKITELEQVAENKQLKKELAKANKVNEKFKNKINLLNNNKEKEEAELRKELNQKDRINFEKMENKIKEIRKEDEHVLFMERKKFATEKAKLIAENDRKINMEKNNCLELEQNLRIKMNELTKINQILSTIKAGVSGEVTIVTLDAAVNVKKSTCVCIGVPESIEEIIEWINILNPRECILVQEVISRKFWLDLISELDKRNIDMKVKLESKYELVKKGDK